MNNIFKRGVDEMKGGGWLKMSWLLMCGFEVGGEERNDGRDMVMRGVGVGLCGK